MIEQAFHSSLTASDDAFFYFYFYFYWPSIWCIHCCWDVRRISLTQTHTRKESVFWPSLRCFLQSLSKMRWRRSPDFQNPQKSWEGRDIAREYQWSESSLGTVRASVFSVNNWHKRRGYKRDSVGVSGVFQMRWALRLDGGSAAALTNVRLWTLQCMCDNLHSAS